MPTRIFLTITFAFFLTLGPAAFSFAQNNPTIIPEILREGPEGLGRQPAPATTPTGFLDNLYRWMLGFVGIAALLAIVYGGVLYIFSGAIESTTEAKRWIWNALLGLLIAGLSYLILRTINPELVKKFDVENIIKKGVQRIR